MDVSSLTINRLSVYLRCLRLLQEDGIETTSSKDLATRFQLSAALIRKDLTQFGEFGVRGMGYRVDALIERLKEVLGIDTVHRVVVVGMGDLGSALARHLSLSEDTFEVVGGVDINPDLVGTRIGPVLVRHSDQLARVIEETRATIGILTVPAEFAHANYQALMAAGIKSVLNFAPVRLEEQTNLPLRNVDVRVTLEELAFRMKSQ